MSSFDELTCQELVELVTEYLEGTSSTEGAHFDEYYGRYGRCRDFVEQMR